MMKHFRLILDGVASVLLLASAGCNKKTDSPVVVEPPSKPVPVQAKPAAPKEDSSKAAEGQTRTILSQLSAKFEEDLSLPGKPIRSIAIANNVSDEGLALICAGAPRLQKLSLTKTTVTKSGLAAVAKLPELKELDLRDAKVAEADVAPLAECKSLRKLIVWLPVERPPTGETLPLLTQLEWLQVGGVYADDTLLKKLASLGNLRQLHIGECKGMTDSGVAELKALAKLERLTLFGSLALTDKCLDEFKSFKNLKALHLDYSKVTPAGAEAFKAAVPGCRIIFGVNQSR